MGQTREAQLRATAAALTKAIAASDGEAMKRLYTPDAVAWHSTDQNEIALPDLIGLLGGIGAVATGEIELRDRFLTDAGFVQTHALTYTFRAGGSTTIHCALVTWVDDDGLITRVEEYLDGEQLAPLIDALGTPSLEEAASS